jgi:hypothetical protein
VVKEQENEAIPKSQASLTQDVGVGMESFPLAVAYDARHVDRSPKGVHHEALLPSDLSVAANLTYAGVVGIDLEPYANIRKWYGTIEARDAWQRSAPPPAG